MNDFCGRYPRELIGRSAEKFVTEEAEKPRVVQFYAPWCGHCQETSPEVDKLQKELCNDADVARINVDTNPDIAARFKVESLPTVMVFRGGKQVAKSVGSGTSASFAKMVNRVISKARQVRGKK